MTKEENVFKIKKRIEYEEQINIEKKKITQNTFITGIVLAAVIMGSNIATIPGLVPPFEHPLLFTNIIFINSIFGLSRLRKIIESISRKTMLESKIEDINNDLEMADLEMADLENTNNDSIIAINEENKNMRL